MEYRGLDNIMTKERISNSKRKCRRNQELMESKCGGVQTAIISCQLFGHTSYGILKCRSDGLSVRYRRKCLLLHVFDVWNTFTWPDPPQTSTVDETDAGNRYKDHECILCKDVIFYNKG